MKILLVKQLNSFTQRVLQHLQSLILNCSCLFVKIVYSVILIILTYRLFYNFYKTCCHPLYVQSVYKMSGIDERLDERIVTSQRYKAPRSRTQQNRHGYQYVRVLQDFLVEFASLVCKRYGTGPRAQLLNKIIK